MKRIIWHWSAGTHTPSTLDKEHYHFIIAGDGTVHPGKWPVEANEKPVKGKYAAHTLNCNTGSIGIAVAAMAGAIERPFDAGKYPITPAQVDALIALSRKLGKQYGIPVTPQTMLSHAEVQPTLGIKQRGKWDIAWLPGMDAPGDSVSVGGKLRALFLTPNPVADSLAPDPAAKPAPKPPATAPQAVPPAPAPAKPAKPRTGPALVVGGIVAVIYAASDTLAEWWQAFVNLF